MKTTMKMLACAALSGSVALVACGDDDETPPPTSTGTTTTSAAGGDGGTGGTDQTGGGGMGGSGGDGTPPPPTLGAQRDRSGRPAINTALNDRFSNNHDASADTWNEDDDPSTWASSYTSNVAPSLAVYDALEAGLVNDACGNQALSCNDGSAGCYDMLAGALANDWLVINAAGSEASAYLGVETGFIDGTPSESRGGRKTEHDVIATSYSVLSGVTFDDGITAPSQAQVSEFPYLAPPN